jgi:hypothetical protein
MSVFGTLYLNGLLIDLGTLRVKGLLWFFGTLSWLGFAIEPWHAVVD